MISYSISFLCLTYFTYHNTLQNHPGCWKWQGCILSYGLIVFHCLYMCVAKSRTRLSNWTELTDICVYTYVYIYVCIHTYTHTHTHHFLYSFIYWCTVGLLPYLDNCILPWILGCMYLFLLMVLFFGYIPGSGIVELYGSSLSSLCVKLNMCSSFRPSRYSLVSNVLSWHLK